MQHGRPGVRVALHLFALSTTVWQCGEPQRADMARAASDIGDTQVEQSNHRIAGFEALSDQIVKRMLDQRLDEIVRCIMGPGGSTLVSFT